ncbi:hypothetical protein [Veronia pacifica]|uniref:hypothetical protein n=1 Tax=Veronia pacifica TaxID=1080227 RepID=UPI001C310798|nr:hypothetical protein [Veronia pacifica]
MNSETKITEKYRIKENNIEVIGWSFEATLRQYFDYSLYPFDHKTVWIHLWAKDFYRNVVLVPDFDAYKSVSSTETFGLEKDIVLGTWESDNTYFNYRYSNYDSNFGNSAYIGQNGFPELHFNVLLKRKFENAFIVYLLPLFLVATLLFSALLTITDKEHLESRFGFTMSGFISACSALFFVVMLAHIQLREEFPGSGIVYIEYFYILMYCLLALASTNAYLFSVRARWARIIHYGDNIIAKQGYWPLTLIALVGITLSVR